jgi:hypothetical protein
MSLISLLVNDWLPTELFGVACCVVLESEGCGGFTDGEGLALAIPLLFFAVFFFALSVGFQTF